MFTALLVLALFWHVGVYDSQTLLTNPAARGMYVGNLLGLAFMMTNNICFSSSSGVIIQMPLQVPVFKRELANKMYSSSAYFLGRFWSNTILQLFYPISTVLVIFAGLKIDESFDNILLFILYAVILNLVMVAQGYFCGVCTDNDQAANQINTFLMLFFMLTSGGLANAGSFPSYIMALAYISPQRYAC